MNLYIFGHYWVRLARNLSLWLRIHNNYWLINALHMGNDVCAVPVNNCHLVSFCLVVRNDCRCINCERATTIVHSSSTQNENFRIIIWVGLTFVVWLRASPTHSFDLSHAFVTEYYRIVRVFHGWNRSFPTKNNPNGPFCGYCCRIVWPTPMVQHQHFTAIHKLTCFRFSGNIIMCLMHCVRCGCVKKLSISRSVDAFPSFKVLSHYYLLHKWYFRAHYAGKFIRLAYTTRKTEYKRWTRKQREKEKEKNEWMKWRDKRCFCLSNRHGDHQKLKAAISQFPLPSHRRRHGSGTGGNDHVGDDENDVTLWWW